MGADPGMLEAFGEKALRMDIPAGIDGIDIGPDPDATPFQLAQRLAAEAWGAQRSWFLLNGASCGNHAISLALAHVGEEIVVQRNVHSSVIDAMVMSGLRPHFVSPVLDEDLGVAHCMTPEMLGEALDANPAAVAAIAISPTYFGAVADIAGLAEAAHSRDVPLIVDEAWGAHLAFSDELPDHALACGADIVLNSVHKLAGSLTQSAILHLGSARHIDPLLLDRAVTMVESTSPNALLAGSLDAARRHNAIRGTELLAETIASLRELHVKVAEIPGLDVLDESLADAPSVHAWDPLRVSVDVRGTAATGNEIARILREEHNCWVELYSENVIVAVFGIGEHVASTGARLLAALHDAAERVGPAKGARPPFAPPPPWRDPVITPREAFLGPQDVVAFDDAEGRIAAESLAAYPPGVPNVLPGERLSRQTLAFISDSLAHGGQVRGASDRTLSTIRVVRE